MKCSTDDTFRRISDVAVTVAARDLRPGDVFPVGGILRGVTGVERHDDGTVTVSYFPGGGLVRVPADLKIKGVC